MSAILSNVSYANSEYTVTGSNGSITFPQSTTGSYYIQYGVYITPSFLHNYTATIKDATSNLNVTLSNSNLSISNKTSNLFNVYSPYLQASAYNILGINRYDDSVIVSVNGSNIVRVTSSNELPQAFDNSVVQFSGSNGGKLSNIAYQPMAVTTVPMEFTKSVKVATTLTASNVTACNIVSLSNQLNITSNTVFWSSNNLLNKNTSGTINGFLNVQSNELRVYPTGDPNAGIRVIGNGVDGNTPSGYNGGLASWWGIGLKCHLDGKTRFLHDTRTGNTYMEGSVGIGKSNPSFKLDVLGNARVHGFSGSIGLTVSNNTNPSIEVNNGASALNIGVANVAGAYSTDAATNDTIVRNNGGKLLLQSGSGASAICVNTTNNVGIGTVNPSHKLDVAGNVNALSFSGATIASLSNLGMSASNTAVWASNNTSNIINRTTDYISNFFTDNLVLQNSLNIIGSGWTWSNGWKAYSQYGGYVLRNGQDGGIQFWTGTSNNGLGYKAVLTSNGNFGIGTGTPTDRLTVAGNTKILGDGNPGGLVLSNNNSPGISIQVSNASTEIGMACFNGAYSFDAVVGDCIIRSTSNLILQTGAGFASVCINSNNNLGIKTINPMYNLHVAGSLFASNITSPTIDTINNTSVWTSNLTTSTYYKSEFASNTAVWSSNTARWTSNYTGALSNLGMDALTKAQWSSNNFGLWRGTTAFAMPSNAAFFYNSNVSLPFESYALMQYSNGLTEINGSRSNGVIICSHGAIIASFSNNTMEMNGGDISTYGLRAWAETTLKRGSNASPGTYTHFPYTNGLNYIRGTTILADTSENEKVGIGTTAPAYKLEVAGTTRLSSLIVGSNSEEMKSIRHYTVSVLPNTSGSPRTVQVDAGGSYPSLCSIYAQMRSTSGYNDVFACTVVAQSTSNIRFSVARVDNSNWSQYCWLDFCVVGL